MNAMTISEQMRGDALQNFRRIKSSICRQRDMVGDRLSEQDTCSKYLSTAMANDVRGVALAVWGTQPRGRMLIAEMSVNSSITELIQAENTTKNELALLVDL
jgi:hypothetical protein